MSRVLVVGLDGATFDLIRPSVAQGKLPTLGRLMKEGVSGDLESVVPPISFPAWSSFLTGKGPGKHGIFDFVARVPGSYEGRFINATWRRGRTLAGHASDAGKRVAMLSVPLTYPPERLNGVVISGFDAPGIGGIADASAMHPPELYAELRKAVGEFPISPNLEALTGDELIAALLASARAKADIALHLYRQEPWDCFMIVFGETDAVEHHFWKHHDPACPLREPGSVKPSWRDAMLSVYELMDRVLQQFLEHLHDQTTVLVVSDHGHGGNTNKILRLNCWLEKEGFLAFKGSEGSDGAGSLWGSSMRSLLTTAKVVGLKTMPVSVKKLVIRRTRIASRIEAWLRFSQVDWSRTRAYSMESTCPAISINVRGRERNGLVTSGTEYERLRQDIVERLLAWRDPETGEKVVRHAHKREELYAGPYVDQAPDITIEWNLDRGYSFLNGKSKGPGAPLRTLEGEEARSAKSGHHRMNGILIAHGRQVRPSSSIAGARLIDVAPTLLYYLGLPIPDDMDGTVLEGLVEPGHLASHPVSVVHGVAGEPDDKGPRVGWSEEDEEVLKSRLRGLGYLE